MNLEAVYPALPTTQRETPCKIGTDPSGSILLYPHFINVILRSLDPDDCDVSTEGPYRVEVAKYSPSGSHIAFVDDWGRLRVSDGTFKGTHELKYEVRPPLNSIRDISWSHDGQQIAVGGQGDEGSGYVLDVNSGKEVGEIVDVRGQVNCVAFRPCKPSRLAFGTDDGSVSICDGPPFKFATRIEARNKSVICMSYSPNGQFIACGGSDGRLLILDGVSGEIREELGKPAHSGSVMGVSWSPDDTNLVSTGVDGAIHVWAIGSETALNSYVFRRGSEPKFLQTQQLGCVWAKKFIVSVSLSGYISLFDPTDLSLRKVLEGHQESINALCYTDGALISGDEDGVLLFWRNGDARAFDAHNNQVEAIAASKKWIVSCAADNSVVFFNAAGDEMLAKRQLDGQLKGCVTTDLGVTVVATKHSLAVFEGTEKINNFHVDLEITCIALSPDQQEVAVGGYAIPQLFLYSIDNLSKPKRTIPIDQYAKSVSYSKDGKYIAIADVNRIIFCFERDNFTRVMSWKTGYRGEVTCLSWSTEGHYVASCSVDSYVKVHNADDYSDIRTSSHPNSAVMAICWGEKNSLYSAGNDCCIRRWKI